MLVHWLTREEGRKGEGKKEEARGMYEEDFQVLEEMCLQEQRDYEVTKEGDESDLNDKDEQVVIVWICD